MAQRTVFVQSALLPRLLAAIGAGSLLAAPGCGGKTLSSNGEVTDGVDGVEQTSEEQAFTSESVNATTTPHQDTSSPNNTTHAPPPISTSSPTTPTNDTDVASTPPVTTVTTGETTNWTTAVTTSSPVSETSEDTTLVVTSSEAPEPTTAEPALDGGAASLMCEFGNPQRFCVNLAQMDSQARVGVGQIPLDPPRGDDEVAAGWDENGCMKHEWIATGCCNPAEAPGEPQADGSCCYVACEGACCGRPFIVDGAALVALVVPSTSWLLASDTQEQPAVNVELDARARRLLGEVWLEDAKMEHASVASFARFSLDLLRLGAPPELVRDSQLASLDEIEHARIAFAIAEQLSGAALGPGALALGNLSAHSLHEAIAAAIVEGCIGETLASGVIAEQARQCTDPLITSHLTRIAEDELRHAELAWRFVAWSIERYGAIARATVEKTFASAFAKLPAPPMALDLTEEQLRTAGRISAVAWSRVVESVMRNVLEPAATTLLERTARSPKVALTPEAGRTVASAAS